VAIGRFVMRNKQYVAALRAVDGRLMMSTMVFADEVVPSSAVDELDGLDEVQVSDKEVLMAEALVESLSAKFEPKKYRDEYREQVLDLIERKAAGETFEAPAAPAAAAPQVVDLMAALEASVRAAKDARKRHPAGGPDATVGPAKAAKPATKAASKTAAAKQAAKTAKAAKVTELAAADEPAAKPKRVRKSA
jgi:DNA end-binding protein Ku